MNTTRPFLLMAVFFTACQDEIPTLSPHREDITVSVYASGYIKSENQYEVFPTVSGLLEEALVKEGDLVRKGMPLFRLRNELSSLSRENAQLAAQLSDYTSIQNKLNDLRLSLDLAKSKMQHDSLLMIRQQELWAANIGSRVEREQAELNFENSKTAYSSQQLRLADEKRRLNILSEQAQKNLQISRKNENDFIVTSVMEGKVYAILKETGEMVAPQTPLAVIGEADHFIIELQVDEYDITSVTTGQPVRISMDSYKDRIFDAVVTKVNPMVQLRTKTAVIEAEFVTPPPTLYPNLSVEASIILEVKKDVLTIPREYLLGDHQVIKASGDTASIVTGLMDYQKVEILDGLKETDLIRMPGK